MRFSQAFDVAPAQMLAAACQLGMEGVIAKRADSPYVSSRTETWLKLKCGQRQEFVVIGFTDRTGARGEVGGLLLGYHEDGKLRSGWFGRNGLEFEDWPRAFRGAGKIEGGQACSRPRNACPWPLVEADRRAPSTG